MAVVLAALSISLLAGGAAASHGRFFHVTWVESGANTADFNVSAAFRRCGYSGTALDGCPAVGDTITEFIGGSSLAFGDASSATGTLQFKVIAINVAEDWLLGVALEPASSTDTAITHAYAAPGPFLAEIFSCCTIFSLNNNSSGNYRAQTLVDFAAENESPKSSMPPIVTVGNSGVQIFPVPAIDSGGQTLFWRLADATEACGGCAVPQPPGLTINSSTGLVSWDTTSAALGLWFASVVIEARNTAGAIVSTSQVQFLINVANVATNQPPDWVSPPTPAQGTVFTVNAGSSVSFSLQASDPNVGQSVHIDNLGVPAGATFSTTDGNPANASFAWTPTAAQVGDHLVSFTAQDDQSPPLSAVARTYVIRVVNAPPPDTTKPSCSIRVVNGPPKQVIVTLQDTGSGLASIVVTKSANANTVVPPFTPGTTSPVVVTSTKINQSQASQIELRVTDVAGNVTVCDPVLTLTTRQAGKPVTETFSGLPQAESKITLTNGNPGVNRLDVTVNGVTFKLTGLKNGEAWRLDVSSAMKPGSANTISLSAHGKPGGSIDVIIADVWMN